MSQKTREFKVTVPALDGVSAREWKEYITDAVGSWKGQFHPDEPLFDLDGDEVKCVSLGPKRQPDPAVVNVPLDQLREIQLAFRQFDVIEHRQNRELIEHARKLVDQLLKGKEGKRS